MTAHTCPAVDCGEPCPPKMLICPKHWVIVPKNLRNALLRHWRRDQHRDQRPSLAYVDASHRAIAAIARAEGKRYVRASLVNPDQLISSGIGR